MPDLLICFHTHHSRNTTHIHIHILSIWIFYAHGAGKYPGILPRKQHILSPVIHMNDSREVLTSLLKAAQLGQTVIRSVLDQAMDTELSSILRCQLKELTGIESETRSVACQRGWELGDLTPAERFLADHRKRRKLRSQEANSAIAAFLIQSTIKTRIQVLKTLHRCQNRDPVSTLTQKLIDCQTATIRQLESFL